MSSFTTIKGHDGLVLVQDPASAEYDQMPRSAIAAGLADYVLAPEAMGDALVQYVSHASRSGALGRPRPTDEDLDVLGPILARLRARTKYDLRCYRKNMLMRRVQRRMSIYHMARVEDYLARLGSDDDEPARLFRDLLIGVTGFFREAQAYKALAKRVIGPLAERKDQDAPLRVWVPGCSTGEEAYSIAMLLLEVCTHHGRTCRPLIFATDIGEAALEIGRQGVYPVFFDDASVKRDGGFAPVEVRVKPLLGSDVTEALLLVTFAERSTGSQTDTTVTGSRDSVNESATLVQQLERELGAAREELQSNIEQLESSNEELRAAHEEVVSMNEELQSAIEELETSKEELQSLNEELSIVNRQLREKLRELERSGNDITNLISNTDISTIFLDPSMRIKLFTAPAARLFNLRATDVGRSLSDFSSNVSDDRLLIDAEAVLETLAPLEMEVLTNGGHHLLRRIQPYRTQDNRIDGVVITFVDITRQIRARQQLRESEAKLKDLNKTLEERVANRTVELSRREAELRALADNVPSMFSYVDSNEVYQYVNRLYVEHFGCPAEQIIGKTVRELLGPENYAHVKPHIEKVLAGDADRYSHRFAFPDGMHTMDVLYVPDKDSHGSTRGFYVLVHDVTEFMELERRLRDSEQRLRAIVDTAADGIITIDQHGIVRDFNGAAERIVGRPTATAIGRNVGLLLPPACHVCPDFAACFRTGECVSSSASAYELSGCRPDGTLFPMEVTVSEIAELGLHVAVVRDITERKTLERRIIEVSTAEQERIGRDIHDGVGQQLTALCMFAASLERRLFCAGRPDEAKAARDLVGHLQDTLAQTRALARGLSPVEVDPEGLSDALSRLTEKVRMASGVECRFEVAASVKVTNEIMAMHLYRIAQEAINNALRHGGPDHILVRLANEDHALVLSVRDDGSGFGLVEDPDSGLGMHIIRYRAGIIGGRISIESSEGRGTLVRCVVPGKC